MIYEINVEVQISNLLESYRNIYRKSSVKRECHDENMFLKANRASSKLNFHFHSKSKTNLVTSRKCILYLQYYKIDLTFRIKLQEINSNVCEEYKSEREARGPNRTVHEARRSNRAPISALKLVSYAQSV